MLPSSRKPGGDFSRYGVFQPPCHDLRRIGDRSANLVNPASLPFSLRWAVVAKVAAPLLILASGVAHAQEFEPRAYSNAPVGMNFLVAAYGYSDGTIAFDPSTPITDATFRAHGALLAYARSFDAWGRSAKFDVLLPYTSFSGHGLVAGQPREREMAGMADPRARVSVNFFGAPALTLKEFAGYRQDLIVGASLQVSAPWGQYDNTKLVNIGNNRWSFKPEIGLSKAWGPWSTDLAVSATYYTDNQDFNRGSTFEQAPLYALQGHLIYGFSSGRWLALNGTYFSGGRTTVNGVRGNNLQSNTRVGLTLALPIDRHHSVKISAGTGAWTRTGSEFDALAVAWQYRWGEGF